MIQQLRSGLWRSYIRCSMLVIWDTKRRSSKFRRHLTRQTSPLKLGIMCWVVRSTKKKGASAGFPQTYLEPFTLPEQKCIDGSMDFVMGLPVFDKGHDGILTVVDWATKMVHLVSVKQIILASKTAQIYWTNIGKLHGIPWFVVCNRGPRFVSRFW